MTLLVRSSAHKARYILATKVNGTRSVDFVESQPCCFGPIHTGDKVERPLDIRVTETAVSATKSIELTAVSTATSCQIQVVADSSPKPAIKSTVSAAKSTILAKVDFVACVYWA